MSMQSLCDEHYFLHTISPSFSKIVKHRPYKWEHFNSKCARKKVLFIHHHITTIVRSLLFHRLNNIQTVIGVTVLVLGRWDIAFIVDVSHLLLNLLNFKYAHVLGWKSKINRSNTHSGDRVLHIIPFMNLWCC